MKVDPQELIKKALKKDCQQADVFISHSLSNRVEIVSQNIESIDKNKLNGIALRIIKNKKLGFSYSFDFSAKVLEDLIDEAISNSKNQTEEVDFEFINEGIEFKKNNFFDSKISKLSLEKKVELAKDIEKAAYDFDKRIVKTEKSSFTDSEFEILIANTSGFCRSFKGNHCGGFVEIIATEAKEVNSGFSMEYVGSFEEFDPKKVGKDAAFRAVQLLGAKPIPPQKLLLVFPPFVATQFLGALAICFSGEQIYKGKSFLKGKENQKIFSELITIIDDGSMKRGIASSPFDGEGIPTRENILIENGVLKSYIFDLLYAKRFDKKSTGNSQRRSVKSPPGIGPSNLYIKSGSDKPEKFIQNIGKGFLVNQVMGMHTIDPISGEFSVGASGILIENGERSIPVRGVTIASNLKDIFANILAIASDLHFYPFSANLGSPTLLIEGVSLSG